MKNNPTIAIPSGSLLKEHIIEGKIPSRETLLDEIKLLCGVHLFKLYSCQKPTEALKALASITKTIQSFDDQEDNQLSQEELIFAAEQLIESLKKGN